MATGSVKKSRRSRPSRLLFPADLGELIGPEWAEVEIGPGGLTLPGWRRPFAADELRGLFFRLQELELLRLELSRLRAERADAWRRAEAAEDRAEWYRRQLGTASRYAALLTSLAP